MKEKKQEQIITKAKDSVDNFLKSRKDLSKVKKDEKKPLFDKSIQIKSIKDYKIQD